MSGGLALICARQRLDEEVLLLLILFEIATQSCKQGTIIPFYLPVTLQVIFLLSHQFGV